ncbi:MAG: D-glycero-alpha-D-manno-heptose-1,7-bisphosphate 7-phosphatase [Bacteroidota bacterium]
MDNETKYKTITTHFSEYLASSPESFNAVVFLDRDGVINVEKSYISDPGQMLLYAFTAQAIRKLNQRNIPVIVVSNQSAIARGFLTLEQLDVVHEKMFADLKKEGACVDAVFYCPHLPPDKAGEFSSNAFIKDCSCRKPKTGLFEAAQHTIGFQKDKTPLFMVGDSERDIIAGKNYGCTTLGVRTGHRCQNNENLPDYMCDDLDDAVNTILKLLD